MWKSHIICIFVGRGMDTSVTRQSVFFSFLVFFFSALQYRRASATGGEEMPRHFFSWWWHWCCRCSSLSLYTPGVYFPIGRVVCLDIRTEFYVAVMINRQRIRQMLLKKKKKQKKKRDVFINKNQQKNKGPRTQKRRATFWIDELFCCRSLFNIRIVRVAGDFNARDSNVKRRLFDEKRNGGGREKKKKSRHI